MSDPPRSTNMIVPTIILPTPSQNDSASLSQTRPNTIRRQKTNANAHASSHMNGEQLPPKKSRRNNNHNRGRAHKNRRHSTISKAARDPRDATTPPSPSSVARSQRSPSPVLDFDGLSRPSVGTRARLEESPAEAKARVDKLSAAVKTILECIGEDPSREGLLQTPERYAKALLFLTKGYQENVRDIVNGAIFNEGHNELVIVKDIDVFSLCEHHMVPFSGKIHVGYIPDQNVIGLSKIPRIVEMFSRRLQVQERLTKSVAETIMEVLKPQGVAVVMESSHLCMVMRGVEKTTASTITSCVLGCIESRERTRNEFFSLLGLNGRR